MERQRERLEGDFQKERYHDDDELKRLDGGVGLELGRLLLRS